MTLRQTAFHRRTAAHGAVFNEYADYDFPSNYGDVTAEYWACRRHAVIIDLTPLRKVEVTGPGSGAVLQATVTRNLDRLSDGDVVYTALCDEEGNVVDDGTVFRFGPDRFRWIGYTDEDEDWFAGHAARLGLDVQFENSTDRLHNIAVQGPESREIMRRIVVTPPGRRGLDDLTWFSFTEGRLGENGPEVLVSRTGYSGELGYEIFCHPDDGEAVFDTVWDAGSDKGIGLLGLDALDIVRIEAGLIFKGYEYEGTEDPFEAGIGFTVPKNKSADYVGKDALQRRREHPTQRLVGLVVDAADPFVTGDRVLAGGEACGTVTSGAVSPGFEKNLALARVAVDHTEAGTPLQLERADGGEVVSATVERIPFYDPEKSKPKS